MNEVVKEDTKQSLLVPLEFNNLNQITELEVNNNMMKIDSSVDSPHNKDFMFNSPRDGDRVAVEATMRRARVSVRARSEASMVLLQLLNFIYFYNCITSFSIYIQRT
jgi:hypothetical protein